MSIWENIFSVKNDFKYKIINLCGLNIRISGKELKNSYYLTKKINLLCISDLGGDFKEYIFKNNMPKIVAKLKLGLDEQSAKNIDRKIEDFLNWPNSKFSENIKGIGFKSYLNSEEIEEQKKWNKEELHKLAKKYKMRHVSQEVFKHHHALKDAPLSVKKYIENKDFFDVGAFVGDSSIILHEYNPRQVYTFEGPNLQSVIKKHLDLNNIPENKYTMENCILGDTEQVLKINQASDHYEGLNVYEEGEIPVEMTTIDNFMSNHQNIDLGLIKMDIEGAEYSAIKGGIESIKKFRPVICSAIYHNPIQFFELKPYLQENLDNYHFEIKNLTTNEVHRETMLFAYPNELV